MKERKPFSYACVITYIKFLMIKLFEYTKIFFTQVEKLSDKFEIMISIMIFVKTLSCSCKVISDLFYPLKV